MQRMSEERVAVDDDEEAQANSIFNAADIERAVPRRGSSSAQRSGPNSPTRRQFKEDAIPEVAGVEDDGGRKEAMETNTEDEPGACRIA